MKSVDLSTIIDVQEDRYLIFEDGRIYDSDKDYWIKSYRFRKNTRIRLLYKAFVGEVKAEERIYKLRNLPMHYNNLKKCPPDNWETIVIEGFNAGVSQEELGNILNVTGVTVHRYMKKLGLNYKERVQYKFRYGKRVKICNTLEEMAKFLNVSSKATAYNLFNNIYKPSKKITDKFDNPRFEIIYNQYELVG